MLKIKQLLSRRADLVILIGIFLLTFFAYFGVWNSGFVYDDVQFSAPGLQTFSPVTKFFTEPGIYMGNYANPRVWRPLGALVRSASRQLFGDRAGFYHLLNLALHLLNLGLLYAVIKKISGKQWLAASVISVIAVHPALTEAITWASSQNTLLWVSLFLLTCLAILSGHSRLSYVIFAADLLMKESVLPGVLVIAALFWLTDTNENGKNKRVIIRVLPYLFLTLFYFSVRTLLVPSINNIDWGTWLIAPYIVWKYLSFIFWPFHLLVLDTLYNNFSVPNNIFNPSVLVGLFSVVVFVWWLVSAYRRGREIEVFGLVWFGAFILPFLQIIPTDAIIGTRALYCPLIGLLIAFISFGEKIIFRFKKTSLVVLIVILLAMSYGVFIRNQDWVNGEAFWQAVLREDPKNGKAMIGLADYYLTDGHSAEKALAVSRQVLALYPGNFGGLLSLATAYAGVGDIKSSEKEFIGLLKVYPGNTRVQSRFQRLYEAIGVRGGIEVHIAWKGDVYFEIHSLSDPNLVIPWESAVLRDFNILLPPGKYYINFKGVKSDEFLVPDAGFFRVTVQP